MRNSLAGKTLLFKKKPSRFNRTIACKLGKLPILHNQSMAASNGEIDEAVWSIAAITILMGAGGEGEKKRGLPNPAVASERT